MAKMRGIKPETWTDDKFVTLTPLARLLFIGMWNYACDNGHLDDSPMQLKMRILPADDTNVADLLNELLGAGLIERQTGWLKVRNLTSHQRIDRRYLTLCDHCDEDPQVTFTDSDQKPRNTPARRAPSGHTSGTRGTAAGAHVEGRKEGEEKKETPPVTPSPATTPDLRLASSATADGVCGSSPFDDFWELYPRKANKGRARTAFIQATTGDDAVDPQTVLDGLRAALPHLRQIDERYRPHPATWLADERWNDDTPTDDDPWAHLDGPHDPRDAS